MLESLKIQQIYCCFFVKIIKFLEFSKKITIKNIVFSNSAVCGISLARLGRNGQFLACSSAILVFFVLYGYLQEFIFAYGDFKPYGWHLTLMQFAYYSLFGFIELQFKQNSGQRI